MARPSGLNTQVLFIMSHHVAMNLRPYLKANAIVKSF